MILLSRYACEWADVTGDLLLLINNVNVGRRRTYQISTGDTLEVSSGYETITGFILVTISRVPVNSLISQLQLSKFVNMYLPPVQVAHSGNRKM